MLSGKKAIVTGGARGIGAAIVRAFAAAGADIAFTYNSSGAKAQELVSEIKMGPYSSRRCFAVKCDAADSSAVEQSMRAMTSELGGIDILVNNAGIVRDDALVRMSNNKWEEVINVNLNGAFYAIRPVLFNFMKQKSGSVINITSIAGVYGNLGQANYSASKAGVVGMTKALSKEVAPFGVRVNAVAPGFIDTDMTTGVDEKQLMQKTKSIPLRRIGTADEVANVVTFLASEKASYITGAEIQVDGGLTL